MSWLGRSLFHLVWLCKPLSPSKKPSAAAPLQPPCQIQIPSSSSELASWEPTADGGKSLRHQFFRKKLLGFLSVTWEPLDVGNPRRVLGGRKPNELVLAVLVVKPLTS